MSNSTSLFQISSSGRMKHMVISASGDKLTTSWWTSKGGVNGAVQTTTETIRGMNEGRANETTPEEQCLLELQRKVTKKVEEGFSLSLEEALSKKVFGIDVYSPLPKEFCPSKPISNLPPSADIYDGSWIAQRKYDGVCLIVQNTSEEKLVYSRRMISITDVVSVLPPVSETLKVVPDGSIFIGELVAFDRDHREDPKVLKAFIHEKTTVEKAVARLRDLEGKGYSFGFHVFDVYVYKGEDVFSKTFLERDSIVKEVFGVSLARIDLNPESVERSKGLGWEGFILRKPEDTITYTLNGKPKRQGAYKYKFIKTTDCYVTQVTTGSGKHENRFARFHLFQRDSNGNPLDCGWAGLGKLGEAEADALTKELLSRGYGLGEVDLKAEDWFVVELDYQSRQDLNKEGQRCFEFPVILRARNDKPILECVFEEGED